MSEETGISPKREPVGNIVQIMISIFLFHDIKIILYKYRNIYESKLFCRAIKRYSACAYSICCELHAVTKLGL